ncbi:MAG: aminopeptidase P family protein [Bacteroidetes bacterium]|nr:aminopeptidase P family protein [Bacteroidota bacterium]MCW5895429.1 aminopeptidase P family protein [Bacteroidota bacterium]
MLIQEKVNQAKAILKEFDIDCWITFVRESSLNGDPTLPFLIDGDVTWHSAFILTQTNAYAIVGQYDKRGVEDVQAYDEVVGYVQGIKEHLLAFMKRIDPKKIAVNYSTGSEICDGLTHGMYLTLRDFLYEIDFQDRLISAEKIISALRQRKTKAEIDNIKEAIRITENIYSDVAQFVKPGKTEKEVAEFMRQKVKKAGVTYAWDPKSCPAVFTGPDTAEAHYGPTDRIIERGQILNMDFGLKYNEYCSDLQRTFYILKEGEDKAPPEVQRGFDTIVTSIELARKQMRPGIEGIEIDKTARGYITQAGYPEYPHGLGHQVGRFAHDGTALLGPAWEKYAQKPFQKLEAGMVFTIEPRLPVSGRGIATVEEMVVVKENGAEFLSTPQRELLLVK